MRTATPILLTLALLSPSKAFAQTHALFTGLGTQPGSISDFDVATARLNWEKPNFFFFANWITFWNPAITGDGRLALWPAKNPGFVGGFVVRDLTTGAMSAGVFPPSLLESLDFADIVVAHPRRLVMYFLIARGSLLVAEPAGYRLVPGCFRPFDATITLDGSLLFIACEDRRILVFDTASESIIREITLSFQTIRLEVNRDGSRLATMDFGGVALRDGNTGQQLALTSPPKNLVRLLGLHTNADRTEIYASFAAATLHETQVLSFDSFSRITTLPVGFHSMAFMADGTTAIGVTPERIEPFDNEFCRVVFVDPSAHVLQNKSYLAYCSGLLTNVTLVQPPLPPTDVTTGVTNRRATLTWQLAAQSPAAIRYAVDVSLEPGGSIVGTLATTSDATSFSIDHVPAGTYYIRIRAINAVGSGPPSPEQKVVVQ